MRRQFFSRRFAARMESPGAHVIDWRPLKSLLQDYQWIDSINGAVSMTELSSHEVTHLLLAWSDGDQSALEKLTPLVYAELHKIAKRHMRRQGENHTLQATALVNEAYLRLIDAGSVRWQNRAHFFAIAAQLMRWMLVDFARRRQKLKRGGAALKVPLEEAAGVARVRAGPGLALSRIEPDGERWGRGRWILNGGDGSSGSITRRWSEGQTGRRPLLTRRVAPMRSCAMKSRACFWRMRGPGGSSPRRL